VGEQLTELARYIYGGILVIFAMIGWWVKRQVARLDHQDTRISELEKDHVTRQEMKDMQAHIDSTVRSSEQRIADRIDRLAERLPSR